MGARLAFAVPMWFIAVAPCAAAAAGISPTALDPQRVAWKTLGFTARKLGLSATVEVRLYDAQADAVGGPQDRPVPPAMERGEILLESTSHLPGRTFLAHEHLDPVRAAVREIVDTEMGAKNHRKTYTLRNRGVLFELLEPANGSEALLAPERWTKLTRSFASYPRALPADAVITGPVGLLYAASAGSLTAPGDSMAFYVLVQAQIERVVVEVEGSEAVGLEFQEDSGRGLRNVHDQVQALRLVARSQPVDPASSSAFRVFGLEGDVEILWDPGRRLPVEISGRVKLIGHVEVRLASVTLH